MRSAAAILASYDAVAKPPAFNMEEVTITRLCIEVALDVRDALAALVPKPPNFGGGGAI